VAVDTDLLPPRYRSPKRIARGGMGEIYRATDSTLGRAVAVKVLAERYSRDEAVRQRFTREALAAARLSGDPNIVTIFDVGEHADRPFIVMEYLSGGSLDDRIRKDGAQEPAQALEWLEQAGRALDAAHAHGVVHRDVKPANLLLDRNGNVHVADFGIASAAGMDSLTMTGTVLGTAGYLSPEQAQGERATAASDRYGLAVVAFELLSGHRPYENESMTAEAAAHVNAPVPSIAEMCESLPDEVDPVFRKALAKDPRERYESAAEFVAALHDALAEAAGATRSMPPVAAVPPPPPPHPAARPTPPRSRRPGAWVGLIALLAAGGIAGGIAAAVFTDDNSSSPKTRTIVRNVTQPGTTVHETVTTRAASPPPPPPPPASATTSTGGTVSRSQAHQLVDQSTFRIRAGDYEGALPIAQRALRSLSGSGDIYEAYANYNVGTSLIHLGRCPEGLPYLDRSEAIQGRRKEIDRDRKLCKKGNE
jgi:serine/threonine protein kinase